MREFRHGIHSTTTLYLDKQLTSTTQAFSSANSGTKVSIIVNTYNGTRYLGECLSSILALQGSYELEIIVVDDASTDETPRLLRSFADSRIVYLRHDRNIGAAAAINTAFEHASGDYVARIDYDDRYRPDFLCKAIAALENSPDAGLVCGAVEMIDVNGLPCGRSSPTQVGIPLGTADLFVDLLRRNFITAPTILARSKVWRKAIPVPSGLNFADWYMSLKMAETSKICVLDDVLAEYRVHPAGMHSTMVLDGCGEQMSERILDYFLVNPGNRKDAAPFTHEIRANHRAEWGDRYFGCNMNAEAKRCYWSATMLAPSVVLGNKGRLRRSLGLLVGRVRYETLKKRLLRSSGNTK